jgi:hypothetical protein
LVQAGFPFQGICKEVGGSWITKGTPLRNVIWKIFCRAWHMNGKTINEDISMSYRTRSVLKGIAVVLALLAVVMQLGWIIIPSISIYKFWFVVIAFGLLLISSK